MKRRTLPITGTGEETRDFTFVDDIVESLLAAGMEESPVWQEFNLASGSETRIIDLENMVNAATGNEAGIRYVSRRNWDTKSRLVASIDRAQDLIGYRPHTTFEEGLDRTAQWFRADWELIERSARFSPGVSATAREVTQPRR